MPVSYVHSLKDFTLSHYPVQKIPVTAITAPEYILEKSAQHVSNGLANTVWTTDVMSGESFTIGQFDNLSRNTASALYKRGLRKGDIVIYMCYDIVKLHTFFTGVWRANGIVSSLYAEELEDSVLQKVVESKCKWILCDPTEAKICLSVAKRVEWPLDVIVMARHVEGCVSIYELFEDDGKACPQLEVTPDDPAIILSTSGSTGRNKGAVHTHDNVVKILEHVATWLEFTENSLFISKAAHVSGSLMTFSMLVRGCNLLTIPRISPETVLNAIHTYKPGMVFGFPSFVQLIAYDDRPETIVAKSCIKHMITGGSNVTFALIQGLKQKLVNLKTVTIGYGLTETMPLTWSTVRANSEAELKEYEGMPDGSTGKVSLGVSLQVRDENTDEPLGPNKIGEFCAKNEIMFTHYFRNEEETAKVKTPDGWFRTGDLGYYDENGFVFFSGRKKELIKVMANHVFPAEIDEVIIKHPSVAEVCTFGVDIPTGETLVRAFVVLKPGCKTSAQEIKEFAHENLPIYKHLKGGLYVVPAFPKGSSGKVTRLMVAQIPLPNTNSA